MYKDATKWPNCYYTWITIPLQELLQHTKRTLMNRFSYSITTYFIPGNKDYHSCCNPHSVYQTYPKWPNCYYTWITIPLQELLQHTKRTLNKWQFIMWLVVLLRIFYTKISLIIMMCQPIKVKDFWLLKWYHLLKLVMHLLIHLIEHYL